MELLNILCYNYIIAKLKLLNFRAKQSIATFALVTESLLGTKLLKFLQKTYSQKILKQNSKTF